MAIPGRKGRSRGRSPVRRGGDFLKLIVYQGLRRWGPFLRKRVTFSIVLQGVIMAGGGGGVKEISLDLAGDGVMMAVR